MKSKVLHCKVKRTVKLTFLLLAFAAGAKVLEVEQTERHCFLALASVSCGEPLAKDAVSDHVGSHFGRLFGHALLGIGVTVSALAVTNHNQHQGQDDPGCKGKD